MSPALRRLLAWIPRSPDLLLAVMVAAIVAVLIVPLPAWALDAGLALELAGSAGLLVTALLVRDPLGVTAFPTLLLLSTFFRLALNVSSTRLALAEGHAGRVIEAFGAFVVRGDYWVGAATFGILAVVQFLVVAKGAERVAEVSARFSLDAMPGKQMSIDADLRAGTLDAAEAQRRRHALERQSQMFGAMDGAMKFVKGDVIAGLVVVAVNLLVGTVVGVVQHGYGIADAAATYALIAIGDGLVSQIPSLCVALAAGLLVTRVTGEEGAGALGSDIGRQFFAQPRVLLVVGGLSAALCAVPEMPVGSFGGLAVLLVGAGLWLRRVAKNGGGEAAEAPSGAPGSATGAVGDAANRARLTGVAPLRLALGAELSRDAGARLGAWVTDGLEGVRERVHRRLGVQPPAIEVRTRVEALPPDGYRLDLDEVPLATGRLCARSVYVRAGLEDLRLFGMEGERCDPDEAGVPVTRVPVAEASRLREAGFAPASALERVAEHVEQVLARHAAKLLGLQETRALVEGLERRAPALVQETLQKIPLPLLTEVLRLLLAEGISIRDLRTLFEALVSPSTEGDAEALAERCRQGLHRYLTHRYAPEGPLYAYLVDPSVEEALRAPGARQGALDLDTVERILESVRAIAGEGRAVVLTAPDTRRALRRLCEGSAPDLAVLTYRELDPTLQIRPLGRITAEARSVPA